LRGTLQVFRLRQKIVLLFLLGITGVGFSQENYFLTLSTTKAKPLAMASAYTSIEDDIVSAFYNPATLSLYQYEKNFRLTFYLNPISPTTYYIYLNQKNNQQAKNSSSIQQFFETTGLFVKSLVFTVKMVDMALIFHEQTADENFLKEQKKFLYGFNIWENSYHTCTARIKLAERVALGIAGSIYFKEIEGKIEQGFGFSYGILLKPSNNLNVGLSFIDFPNNMSGIRLPLERMVDQTMNIGVSYKPLNSTTLSFDLRNLTEEERKSVREAHFGIEQRIFSILAIRGGYFQERFKDSRTFSAGIALFDSNLMFSKDNRFDHSQFMLNYSLVHHRINNQFFNWHVLSLLIRI